MAGSETATELAERSSFDMNLVRSSAIQHQAALDLMLEMERAGQQLRDAAQPSHRPSPRR
jgi:hypothetical protein